MNGGDRLAAMGGGVIGGVVVGAVWWTCYHYGCRQMFAHARDLVRHLMEVHNELPER